jgi:hypothetical protein
VEPLLALGISYPVASGIVHNLSSQRTSDEYVSLGDEDGLDRGRIREHDRLWRTWDVDLPRFVLEPQTGGREPVVARWILETLEHVAKDRDLRAEGIDLARLHGRLALRRARVLRQKRRGDRDAAERDRPWRERLGGDNDGIQNEHGRLQSVSTQEIDQLLIERKWRAGVEC